VTIPEIVLDRVQELSHELKVEFSVERHWENEFGSGYYCRVHGSVHESPALSIELVGSLAVGTRADKVDLFVLVNGVRVGPATRPFHYLHRRDPGPFSWEDLDEGYGVQTTLDGLLLRNQ
jgi:hypothetical protein